MKPRIRRFINWIYTVDQQGVNRGGLANAKPTPENPPENLPQISPLHLECLVAEFRRELKNIHPLDAWGIDPEELVS